MNSPWRSYGGLNKRAERRARRAHKQTTRQRAFRKAHSQSKGATLNALRSLGWALPDRFLVRLRFTDYISFSQASGTYGEYFYRAIGPYDPRVAAGGDYPAYYSQIMALYQYQQVLGSKIRVEPMGNGGTLGATLNELVLYPTTTATGVTAFNDAIDKRGARWCQVSYYFKTALTHKMSPSKNLGLTKAQYRADEDCRSAVGALPARVLYWAVGAQVNDGASQQAFNVRIVINYTIQFSGLVPIDTVDSAND